MTENPAGSAPTEPAAGPLLFGAGFEDTFVVEPRLGARPLDEYELTDHYRHWSADLDRLAAVGADNCRWGIPWYKVNPEPGVFDFGWLDRVVAKFVEIGVEPIVDLLHYGTPRWLDNAFLNSSYPRRFAEYAAAVAARYAGSLHLYTPANEPTVTAERCGEDGQWPPYLVGDDGYVRVLLAVARGVVEAQRAIAEVDPQARFWHVEATRGFVGERHLYADLVGRLEEREYLHQDLVTGRVGADHRLAGYLRDNGVRDEDLAWFAQHAVHPDVLGVNYYPHVSVVEVRPAGPAPRTSQWPVTYRGVEGLVATIRVWHERFGGPVALTETCDPGTVETRVAWLRASVEAVVGLRAEGVPVVGYQWWSLIDMLEWTYREGLDERPAYLLGHGLWDLRWDGYEGFERVRTAAADEFAALAARYGNRTTKERSGSWT